MQRKSSVFHLLISVLMCLLLISCAATKVKQSVLMPANSDQMKNVKKLAVVGFTGDKDNQFSSRMESFFTNIRVQNQAYFSVVDRATLASIMQEQNNAAAANQNTAETQAAEAGTAQASDGENVGLQLSFNDPMAILGALLSSEKQSDASQSSQAAAKKFTRDDAIEMAKRAGADTVITGSVNGPRVLKTPYKEERKVCVEEANKKCKKYEMQKVDCVNQQGRINFVLKAVDINSGDITFTKNYSSNIEDKHCNGDYSSPKTEAELSQGALDNVIAQTRNDVAPYVAIVTIELMEKDDSGLAGNKQAKMLMDTGIKFAKDKQMRQACDNFKLASESYNQSPAIFHNMGVCAEIANKLDEASGLYTQAASLSSKSSKLIDAALQRVNERRAKNKQVESQLR